MVRDGGGVDHDEDHSRQSDSTDLLSMEQIDIQHANDVNIPWTLIKTNAHLWSLLEAKGQQRSCRSV